ncbi:MAG: DNRLRE domain-containing protein [Pirellulales bacterium]|nr:DNRLRE domain-containing protein [Pirellulales bacterium]
MSRILSRRLILGSLAVGLLFAARAQAAVHVADSFLTGGNPAAGQYALGGLVGQGPTVSSFTGAWADGLPTTAPGAFDAIGTGLAWPHLVNVAGGAVQFVNDAGVTGTQSAVRTFDNPNMTAGGNYFLAGMMSFDASFATGTTSSAFTGVLNAEEGDASVDWIMGMQWGFRGNDTGGVDAVVRYRDQVGSVHEVREYTLATNVTPGQHLFVTYLDSDYIAGKSGDWNYVWFDPVVNRGVFGAGAPQLSRAGTNWLSPGDPYNPLRVVDTVVFNATDLGAGAAVTYDEVRLGDTWQDVANDGQSGAVFAANPFDGYDHAGTYFREADPTSSRGSQTILQVGSLVPDLISPTSRLRSVLSFSLDSVADGATVTSATLKLSVSRVDETEADVNQIDLFLADLPPEFDENTANWNRAAMVEEIFDIPWGASGPGNPTDTLLSSLIDPTPGMTEAVFGSSAAFVAAAQAAINGNTPLDLALIAPFENDGVRHFIEFYSEDTTDFLLHPVLTLTFQTAVNVPGDTNSDGAVDGEDAAVLARNWLQEVGGGAPNGDFNVDGWVDDLDLAILAANWAPADGSTAVPEPSVLALAGAALALLLLRRRIG